MTTLFQTDNIFFLPPGKPFEIFDLAAWRKITIDVQSLKVEINEKAKQDILNRAEQALDFAVSFEEETTEQLEKARMDIFVDSLPFAKFDSNEASDELTKALAPLKASFWVKISQTPTESFFHEDYEPHDHRQFNKQVMQCYGAVAYNAIGDLESDFPSVDPFYFRLLAPENALLTTSKPIEILKPLPLMRQYCGLLGSSSEGQMVTIDINSNIPQASMAAIPIAQTSSVYYETLYIHIPIPIETPPIMPFRPEHANKVADSLKSAGFQPKIKTRRFSLWSKGKNVIQLYRNLPGKESEGAAILPPFCIAVLAEGSPNCAARHQLLKEIFPGAEK